VMRGMIIKRDAVKLLYLLGKSSQLKVLNVALNVSKGDEKANVSIMTILD
jgi:hypothetical protein